MNVKNRIKSGLSAALVLLAVSCSQDDALQTTVNDTDGLVPVTLSATIDHGVQTRAATSETDDEATRCLLQIIESDGTTTTKRDVQAMDLGADGSYTATAMLNPYRTYTFLFWADDGSYNADDLESITITNAISAGIAWHGKAEWSSTSGSTSIDATLTHAVAKVSLKTTTTVADGTSVSVTLPTAYTEYNVNTTTLSGEVSNTTFSYTTTEEVIGTTDGADVFSFYALVSDETQNLTLQTGNQPAVTIPSVPLAPNKHVILSGDVTNAGLTEFTFTATINETWASTETLIEGLKIENGTYFVSTAAALQAWASYVNAGNRSTNCTLGADIDMTGQSNWTPVGTTSNAYTGTFDGAGYTISGLTISNSNNYVGFIGYLNGTVKNLHIKEATVTGSAAVSYVGGIVGGNEGTIAGCSFSGSVEQTEDLGYAGGIAGANYGKVIACCSAGTVKSPSSSITNPTPGGFAGGVVGRASYSTTLSCYSTSTVSGMRTGGVVGSNTSATITACYSGTNNNWTEVAETMNQALTEGNYKWQWETNAGTDADTFPLIAVETE